MGRRLRVVTYSIAAAFLALALATVGRVTAQDWRTASHEPVGIAPDPRTVPEAMIQVYAARAFGWPLRSAMVEACRFGDRCAR